MIFHSFRRITDFFQFVQRAVQFRRGYTACQFIGCSDASDLRTGFQSVAHPLHEVFYVIIHHCGRLAQILQTVEIGSQCPKLVPDFIGQIHVLGFLQHCSHCTDLHHSLCLAGRHESDIFPSKHTVFIINF